MYMLKESRRAFVPPSGLAIRLHCVSQVIESKLRSRARRQTISTLIFTYSIGVRAFAKQQQYLTAIRISTTRRSTNPRPSRHSG